ncbi:Uncharacterized protein F44B9.2 [Toxocara canis]|uniref:Uncharacterized protein F44B9.2 n=1 Tax=Toxocara canis TaxID=6265 RepID=A0A0B2VVH0_TOXCA|nr:Uncharacterized protein F44B9.2 [Toxocara canis]
MELKKAAQLSAGVEWHNVDCVRIGECFLREPSGAIVLPNTSIFVTDSQLGLFLFSLNSDLIRNVSNVDWRWAQGAALLPNGHLLVSMMVRESSAVPWRRFIMKFDSDLNFVAKVEGPKWIEEETILRERLCAASNGNIYFAVAGETFSALYELSPDAKWTELEHKRGQTFIDVQVLAVVGPVTELLLVEERRGCVCLYGIRESSVAVRRSMTPVERPGAMCIDEQQQLFLHLADGRHQKPSEFDCSHVLAVVGPVTELLLVEERRGCVCLYGIRESSVAVRRSMTPVERPGAMCIDEQQQLFLHDLRQAKVRHIQTSGNSFEPDADVALAEKSLYALSANNGFLAATYRSINLVRVHKYKSIK